MAWEPVIDKVCLYQKTKKVVVKVVQTDSVAQEQDDRNISLDPCADQKVFFQTKATLNNTNYEQEKKV